MTRFASKIGGAVGVAGRRGVIETGQMMRLVGAGVAGLVGWLVLIVLAGALLDHGGAPRLLTGFGLVVAASALSLFGPIWLVPKRGGGSRVLVVAAAVFGVLGLLTGIAAAVWDFPAAIQFGSWYRCVVGSGRAFDPVRHLVAPIGPIDECTATGYARGTWITLGLGLISFGGPTVAAVVARRGRNLVHAGQTRADDGPSLGSGVQSDDASGFGPGVQSGQAPGVRSDDGPGFGSDDGPGFGPDDALGRSDSGDRGPDSRSV